MSNYSMPDPSGYLSATGEIQETLINDMVFHKVMSTSHAALVGLCCALKNIDQKEVTDAQILNPIDYGKVSNKEIVLDVKIELNHREIMNIEIMNYFPANWDNRSLLYLCRCFDNINAGVDYGQVKPATHVGIMAIPDKNRIPEFYAKYLLTNSSTGEVYTSNFCLNVLNLSYVELATEQDKKNKLDYWARLFRSKTWEEFRDLARDDEAFREVGEIMYSINVQDEERTIYEAHRKYMEEYRSQYSAGVHKGFEDGMSKGLRDGLEKGLRDGLEKGLKEGREKGLQEGLEKGLQEGLEKGLQEGLEKGLQEGRAEAEAAYEKRLQDAEEKVSEKDREIEELRRKLEEANNKLR